MKNYDKKQIIFFISIALFFSWTIVIFYLFFINPFEQKSNLAPSPATITLQPTPIQSTRVPVLEPTPIQSTPAPVLEPTPIQSTPAPVFEPTPIQSTTAPTQNTPKPTPVQLLATPVITPPPLNPISTPITKEEEIKVPTPEGLGNYNTHLVSELNFSIEIPEDQNIEKRSFSPGDPSFFGTEQLFLYDRRWDLDFVMDVAPFPNDKLYKMDELKSACANRQRTSPYERNGVFGDLEREKKIYWLDSGFEFKHSPLNNIGELVAHYPFASINYANMFLAKRQYAYSPRNLSVQRDIKGSVEYTGYYKTISHCFEYDGLLFTFMIGTPAWEGPNNLLRDAPDAFEILGFEEKQSTLTAGISYEGISDFNPNDPYTIKYRIKQFFNVINSLKFIDPDLNRWTTDDAEYPDWNP